VPRVDLVVSSEPDRTPRVMQLEGMFDVPAQEKLAHRWEGEVPLDARPWNVGLIVGPSGAGKSRVAGHLFGELRTFTWAASSVVDDFAAALGISEIADACAAVGFNTIPSWMKPFGVLSNGERFRVELARHLLESPDPIVVDEFTSVVDRQVAQIASHAVAKHVRAKNRRFVAVSCHWDIVDWLQPDWVLEMPAMTFQWRAVQRRPTLDVELLRVDRAAWRLFAPFHYLTAELHKAAKCFVLAVRGRPAVFAGVLHRPHPRVQNLKSISRIVTLPDYQGLGLAFVFADRLGAMHRALGLRLTINPAHPPFVRAFDRSPLWVMTKKPGRFSPISGRTSSLGGKIGGRPCAAFEYVGPATFPRALAEKMVATGQ
jgi:GNAT superfamily N-acetyltransferase